MITPAMRKSAVNNRSSLHEQAASLSKMAGSFVSTASDGEQSVATRMLSRSSARTPRQPLSPKHSPKQSPKQSPKRSQLTSVGEPPPGPPKTSVWQQQQQLASRASSEEFLRRICNDTAKETANEATREVTMEIRRVADQLRDQCVSQRELIVRQEHFMEVLQDRLPAVNLHDVCFRCRGEGSTHYRCAPCQQANMQTIVHPQYTTEISCPAHVCSSSAMLHNEEVVLDPSGNLQAQGIVMPDGSQPGDRKVISRKFRHHQWLWANQAATVGGVTPGVQQSLSKHHARSLQNPPLQQEKSWASWTTFATERSGLACDSAAASAVAPVQEGSIPAMPTEVPSQLQGAEVGKPLAQLADENEPQSEIPTQQSKSVEKSQADVAGDELVNPTENEDAPIGSSAKFASEVTKTFSMEGEKGDKDDESPRARCRDTSSRSQQKDVIAVKNMFGDLSHKTQLDEEEYDVSKFYFMDGYSQLLARSEAMSNFTLAVIAANAIYIGIEADFNNDNSLGVTDRSMVWRVFDQLFCTYFTLEWIIRFLAFRRKLDCLQDFWFKFDSTLLVLMVFETWVMPLALGGLDVETRARFPTGLIKMLRLLRLARMLRLVRSFPELVAMMKGVKVAARAVGSALLMLIMLIYAFAIMIHMLLKDESMTGVVEERFASLPLCMMTLLIDGTFLDGIGIVCRSILDISERWKALTTFITILLFVLMSALTVMNMLIGVLCEVVSTVAVAEKEDAAIRLVKAHLLVMLKSLDEDGSGAISQDEISQVFVADNCLAVLDNLMVDRTALQEQLDMLYEDAEDLSIHQIMDCILMLRGDRMLTVKDMLQMLSVNLWKIRRVVSQEVVAPCVTSFDHFGDLRMDLALTDAVPKPPAV